jgi:hypothetical protein
MSQFEPTLGWMRRRRAETYSDESETTPTPSKQPGGVQPKPLNMKPPSGLIPMPPGMGPDGTMQPPPMPPQSLQPFSEPPAPGLPSMLPQGLGAEPIMQRQRTPMGDPSQREPQPRHNPIMKSPTSPSPTKSPSSGPSKSPSGKPPASSPGGPGAGAPAMSMRQAMNFLADPGIDTPPPSPMGMPGMGPSPSSPQGPPPAVPAMPPMPSQSPGGPDGSPGIQAGFDDGSGGIFGGGFFP